MPKNFILAPSLLSADFANLAQELRDLNAAGVPWLHLDIMDGEFVPNITFGPLVIEALKKHKGNLVFDVHLMIAKPERYLEDFVKAGADILVVHAEACTHLERTLAYIKDLGAKPGVALNPHTPLSVLEYVLPQCYMALIMSVNPGFGGQKFIPFSVEKIRRLKSMITAADADTLIQVDGGVTPDNADELISAGADVLVSGSAFFKFPPYGERLQTFRNAIL